MEQEQFYASKRLTGLADELAFLQKELPIEFHSELQGLIHDMNQLARKMIPIEV